MLRATTARFYRKHWSSNLPVRHTEIERDGEWVEDPHIIAAAAMLKVRTVVSREYVALLQSKDRYSDV